MNESQNDLHELFVEELADLLDAEKQLTKALPKLAEAADSPDLAEAFTIHLRETEGHFNRLLQVFKAVGESPGQNTCEAMQGLIAEGEELIEEQQDSTALDFGLIAAAQKVENYEICAYKTLCGWAQQLSHMDAVALLKQNQQEEEAADAKLTQIAESLAHPQIHPEQKKAA